MFGLICVRFSGIKPPPKYAFFFFLYKTFVFFDVLLRAMRILTQAGRIQGLRRWCLPSSRAPWRCQSEARPRCPLPWQQIRTDGWASRSRAARRGKWFRVVRYWSPSSGCNTWAQRLTPSRSPWPALASRGETESTINLELIEAELERRHELMNMLTSVLIIISLRPS